MWVFGYGSLMWDGWEERFEGVRHEGAILAGYQRAFNKKSVVNWGTPERPGPTLGLEPDEGARCVGTAFRFPDLRRCELIDYLDEREGAGFGLRALPVVLEDDTTIVAITAVNDRTAFTYIGDEPLDLRAAMVLEAEGSYGRCIDYLDGIRRMLRELSIDAPRVEEFWRAVRQARSER